MENRRVPINVSNSPSEYAGRSIRLGGNTDIREKMNQRMREFEDESRKWREQFLTSSSLQQPASVSGSSLLDRPRMFFNFPEFPELSPSFTSPLSSRLAARDNFFPSANGSLQQPFAQTSHKSFMEEDDQGQKKFKVTFDIGDFKPSEIQVKTDGRQLIVKGDREVNAGTATESKQFNREITLPEFVEPTSVQSFLSEGVLTVEAPIQMDRLAYSSSQPITTQSSSVSTSSSGMRNSPLRDTQSPGRSILRNAAQQQQQPLVPQPPATQLFSNYEAQSQSPVVYKFNMAEFKPEDIAITVTDTTLKVHAVREESDFQSSGNTYREFKREIGLPHGADVKRLKNSLQPDGTLIIEIPVVDNAGHRPPLSPSNLSKQFGNFSLDDNNNNSRVASSQAVHSQPPPPPPQPQSSSLASNTNSGGLINSVNDGKDLRLTFDLTGYKPEDLSIKVIDNNTLKIHAVHIDNSRGNQIHREYTR
jgi:HSP20 family molecular chaperone IbpA